MKIQFCNRNEIYSVCKMLEIFLLCICIQKHSQCHSKRLFWWIKADSLEYWKSYSFIKDSLNYSRYWYWLARYSQKLKLGNCRNPKKDPDMQLQWVNFMLDVYQVLMQRDDRKMLFFKRVVGHRNSFPKEVVTASTLTQFKKRLDSTQTRGVQSRRLDLIFVGLFQLRIVYDSIYF